MSEKLFLADSNNKTNIKDSFGVHTNIADTIVEIANNETLTDSSFNLGLFGSWGSGKSYIINNIISKLKDNYAIFNIDVWKYVGQPLMRSILFDMDTQLKNNKFGVYNDGYINNQNNSLEKLLYADTDFEEEIDLKWNELCQKLSPILKSLLNIAIVIIAISAFCYLFGNNWLKSLSIPLFSGVGYIGAPAIFIYLFKEQLKNLTKTIFCSKKIKTYTYKPTFSPEQFETIFSDIVTKISLNKKKVLIIFDNLDRCEPKYAYETLSAIKTFMDKENCFYIIPCDDIAIKKYISASYNVVKNDNKFAQIIGDEFFDKLFNTYIRIPQLQEIDRDIFIEEQLKELSIYSQIKSNINEIKQVLFFGYRGSTPRQIKRFINDFSINYMLANNIDPEHKFILNNLTLFSIMVVIKQKWSDIEELLIKDPDLFSTEIENDEYKLFISRIKNLLPNKIPSLMPFIYLKETIDAKSVSNELKGGLLIKDVSDSVINRIKNEIQQMIEKNEISYLQNAAVVVFNTLQNKDLTDNNKIQLIRNLGDILLLDNINFVDFMETISEELDRFLSYIPNMRDKQCINIKKLFSYFLQLNDKDDISANEEIMSEKLKIQIFDKITEDGSVIDDSYISAVFNNFKNISQVDTSIQKYIEILNNKNKLSLIPKKFINFIISAISKDAFSDNAINVLKYYNRSSLDIDCKKQLAQKLNEIVNVAQDNAPNYSNQLSILNGIKLSLKLVDKESFTQEALNKFNTALHKFINALYAYSAATAMEMLIDAMLLVTNETDLSYEGILRNILRTVDRHQNFIKILTDNNCKLHVENIINCNASKRFLLGMPDIRNTIYIILKDFISSLYKQLLREEDNSMDELKALLSVINEYEVKINKEEFKEYILTKYHNEENLEKTFSLYELLNNNNIKLLEKDFTSIKNTTIDSYKQDANSGIRYLQIAGNILTEKQFNKIFLTPILNYIFNELEATKPVSGYMNIVTLIKSESAKSNSKLLKEIVNMLLEDNQEAAEYEFACNIISLLKDNSVDVNEFQEKVSLRLNFVNSNLQNKINQIYANQIQQ